MIRSIDNTQASEAVSQQQVKPSTPAAKKSFASELSKAATTPKAQKLEVPQGETWTPVPGRENAAKITGGPRAGQYINLSHGDRRGQTFSVETRNGQQVHVYKASGKEVVVGSKADEEQSARKINGKRYDNGVRIPKGEKWAPVEGHDNYADILNGKRNGLFVNISGGVRDGMAFQVVKHSGKTFHVYGSGKHRQEIEVHAPKNQTSGGTPATTGTTGATGSTSPTGSSDATSQSGPAGA
jgi:hypothetical protein